MSANIVKCADNAILPLDEEKGETANFEGVVVSRLGEAAYVGGIEPCLFVALLFFLAFLFEMVWHETSTRYYSLI